MLEKQTIIDKIEIASNGAIAFRLGLLIIEDGEVLARNWHRSGVEPGGDVDAQFALVNTHLVSMGKRAVPAAEISRLKDISAVVWTPAVIAVHRAKAA